MRHIEFNGWHYCWTTVRNEYFVSDDIDYPADKPFASWIEKPNPVYNWRNPTTYDIAPSGSYDRHLKKVTYFKTRASARRSAKRQRETHEFRNKHQQALRDSGYMPPSKLCGSCEENPKVTGDYLCKECRYG